MKELVQEHKTAKDVLLLGRQIRSTKQGKNLASYDYLLGDSRFSFFSDLRSGTLVNRRTDVGGRSAWIQLLPLPLTSVVTHSQVIWPLYPFDFYKVRII